jgi:hypothetical protein
VQDKKHRKREKMKKILFIAILFAMTMGMLYSQDAVLLDENFDGNQWPPTGWTLGPNVGGFNWFNASALDLGGRNGSVGAAASRSWDNSAEAPVLANNWLVTPPLSLAAGTAYDLKFWYIAQDQSWPADRISVFISTTTNTVDLGNLANWIVLMPELTVTAGPWREISISLAAYAGENVYIAFRHHQPNNDMFIVKIDDVSVTRALDNDLAVTAFTGPTTVFATTTGSYSVTVANLGGVFVDDEQYGIKIYSMVGTTPNPGSDVLLKTEEATISMTGGATQTYTFDIDGAFPPAGLNSLYAHIYYTNSTVDENPANNFSDILAVNKRFDADAGVTIAGVPATETNGSPFNYHWENNLSQTIYLASELAEFPAGSAITHLTYRFNAIGDVPANIPLSIWMAHHGADTFTATNGWKPFNELTAVWVSTPYPHTQTPGTRDIEFELQTPFIYDGTSNLLIMTQRHRPPNAWFNSGNSWVATSTVGVNRTLRAQADSPTYDPSVNYPTGSFFAGYPNIIMLSSSAENRGELSGTVEDEQGTPVPGVLVSVLGTSDFDTTDSDGNYFIPGTSRHAPIRFTKEGWYTQTWNPVETTPGANEFVWTGSVGNWEAEIYVEFVPRSQHVFSGTVKGNNTGAGVEGARVFVTGYINRDVTTAADGTFSFPVLYGDGDLNYVITVRAAGYDRYFDDETLIELSAEVSGLTIVLEEAMRDVGSVRAEIITVEATDKVKLTFGDPSFRQARFSHSDGVAVDGIGTNGPNQFKVGHRYTQAHLEEMGASELSLWKVGFVPNNTAATYTVEIFNPAAGAFPNATAPAYSQTAVGPFVNMAWHEVELTTPFNIPESGDLMVMISINTPSGHPAGIDGAPTVVGFGNVMFFGGDWTLLTDITTIQGNWAIMCWANEPTTPDAPPIALVPNRVTPQTFPVNSDTSLLSLSGDVLDPSSAIRPAFHLRDYSRNMTGDFVINRLAAGTTELPETPLIIVTPTELEEDGARFFTWTDASWANVADGMYRYSVQTQYGPIVYPEPGDDRVSNPIFSNTVNKNATGTITVSVARSGGGTVVGAQVTMRLLPEGAPVTQTITTGTTTVFNDVALGVPHNVRVNMPGVGSYENVHVFNTAPFTLPITIVATNTIFAQDFNNFPYLGWANIDADGDDFDWRGSAVGRSGQIGDFAAFSESYCLTSGLCLFPDNWLISPVINVPNLPGSEITLEFWVASDATGGTRLREKLVTYVTTDVTVQTPHAFIDDFHPWNANPNYSELDDDLNEDAEMIDVFVATNNQWVRRAQNLTPYMGQPIQIAFRHSFVSDQQAIKLDDLRLFSFTPPPRFTVSGTVRNNADNQPIEGVVVTLFGLENFSGTTNEAGVFTIPQVFGLYTYSYTVVKSGFVTLNGTIEVSALDYTFAAALLMTPTDDVNDDDVVAPVVATALKNNFPNPFNPTTTIAFDMATEGFVTIDVFNIKGQKVTTLVNGFESAGSHTVVWDGRDDDGRTTASGVYFYRMQTENYSSIKKMVLMK